MTSNSATTNGAGFQLHFTSTGTLDGQPAFGWSFGEPFFKEAITDASWTTTINRPVWAIKGKVTDNTAPEVASIVRHDPMAELTNADSLTWRVTFSEDVMNVDAADFRVYGTTATLTVAAVMGSASTYDVTASGGDLAGQNDFVRLFVARRPSITDTANNALTNIRPTGAEEHRYDVDNIAPAFRTAAVRGTSLDISFSEDLAAAANLANSAFVVRKTPRGGSEQTVSLSGTPSISGATVTLTLSAAVAATDSGVKVRYDKPASGSGNKLRDAAGNETAVFPDQAVTNNANVAATGAPRVTGDARVGRTLTALQGDLADANGLPDPRFPAGYSFQWTRVDGMDEPNISGATSQTYTLTAADQGKKVKVTVTFTDAVGSSESRTSAAFPASGTVGAMSDANTNPALATAMLDQTATEGTAFEYQVPATTFSDTDSDTLTYAATRPDGTALPQWLDFDPATRTFSGAPSDGDVGTLSVKVTASDGDGDGTANDTFDITVAEHCAAPGFGTRRRSWTGVVTVEIELDFFRNHYGYEARKAVGRLDELTISWGGSVWTIQSITVTDGTGRLDFSFPSGSAVGELPTDRQRRALRLHVCDRGYEFSRPDVIRVQNGPPFSFSWNTTLDWSAVSTRTLHLSLPANNAATGAPTISGTAQEGQPLAADTSAIMDADGLTGATFTYE